MAAENSVKYYLVEASMLPEIFIKVTEAKALLETGQAATIAEAVSAVGISRSAFYKYRDAITPFQDMKSDRILTFSIMMYDRMGQLSNVLSIFSGSGANILTINQSIPTNGVAIATISAEMTALKSSLEGLLDRLRAEDGVIRLELLGG